MKKIIGYRIVAWGRICKEFYIEDYATMTGCFDAAKKFSCKNMIYKIEKIYYENEK